MTRASPPLRVAMVTTFYPPLNFGGDGRYVRRLAHALARRGVQVEIVHDADAWRALSGIEEEPAPEPEPPGVTVHRLRSRWALGATLLTHQTGLPLAHGAALRRILARGFDVVHFHNVSLIGGPGVLSLGEGVKLYTAHEHWLVCPTHVLWRHDRELCTGRECLRCAIAYRRPPQPWRATGLLEHHVNQVDAFIALSRSVAENHRTFGFMRAMVPMTSFLPETEWERAAEPVGLPTQRPFFLFVGRLERIKGLQDVVPHFTRPMPADLVIAGEGNFETELRRLAGGNPQIRFIGHQSSEALRTLYRGALALITPSQCYEVFPMVVLEAFRESTPIIARALGPYPEIVADSGAGLLFHDAATLEAALAQMAGDPALREDLAQRARHAVTTRWSEQSAMDAYFELVRSVAGRRGRSDIIAKLDAMAPLDASRTVPAPAAATTPATTALS